MAVSWSSGVLALVLLLPSYLVIQNFVGLAKNYSDARKIGCPRRVIPISPLNPLWMLVDDRILAYVRRLPFGLGNNSFTRYNWRGWEVRDRYHSHKEMGDIWILVTPYRNWVMINDPETIVHVNKRLTEFPRPGFVTDVLAVFGPNVGNASGESWKMQRRLVTRCLNEKNNQIVWSESISLSAEMLSYWESKPSVAHTDRDVRTLTLHVLSRALFGRSFRFEGDDEKQATRLEKTMDYREALGIILSNLLLIVGFGGPRVFRSLPKLGIPKKLHTIRTALDTFGAYMVNTYDDTKARHAKQEKLDANFMAMIVQASQDEASEKGGLNEAEVYGNMFAVSFAGHDTTALTFTFAMYFLAAHPEVQDWVFEEIQAVLGSRDVTELDYRADFHRLKRCLAIMFESLRLYDIVPTIKWTGDHTRQITVRGKAYTLPPETMVLPHYGSLMTDPKYWGDASLDWKPSRWIKTAEGSSQKPGDEDFIAYTRGTFVPWGEGTIDCPGRKFAHVEFVATLAVLLSKHRVEPLKQMGETDQQARERVMDLIENDSAPGLLLQMQHPERAPLVWKQR